jgi:hypothetical protein
MLQICLSLIISNGHHSLVWTILGCVLPFVIVQFLSQFCIDINDNVVPLSDKMSVTHLTKRFYMFSSLCPDLFLNRTVGSDLTVTLK